MVLTRTFVWHLGQVTLKTAFFGTFASGIASLVEQDVQMISIGLFLLHRFGVARVQGQAFDVGRLLAAGLLNLSRPGCTTAFPVAYSSAVSCGIISSA